VYLELKKIITSNAVYIFKEGTAKDQRSELRQEYKIYKLKAIKKSSCIEGFREPM
jgi:hypothetical protein